MSEYPTINVNGIYYLDTPEQRLILIEQLKKRKRRTKEKKRRVNEENKKVNK